MGSITITTKSNSIAKRVSASIGSIPGAVSVRHLGGKRVQITTGDIQATESWCDSPNSVVVSYEYA